MKNIVKYQKNGLIIVVTGIVLSFFAFFSLKFETYTEFVKNEIFTICLIPIFVVGFGCILTGQLKQDISLNTIFKLLLAVLTLVWIVVSVLVIKSRIISI